MVAIDGEPAYLKFSAVLPSHDVASAQLSLRRLWGSDVPHSLLVLGAGSASPISASSERGLGTLLGVLQVPADLEPGGVLVLDVTGFVRMTPDAYLSFALINQGGDEVFSTSPSAEGSALILTQVPEPESAALLAAGLITLAAWLRRRSASAGR